MPSAFIGDILGSDVAPTPSTTIPQRTSNAITVPFIVFFVLAGAVAVLALRTVLTRAHRATNGSAHDGASLHPLDEPPPELQEVCIRRCDAPQPHTWETLTPVSATRIPAVVTEAPTSRPFTNHPLWDIVSEPPAKCSLAQVVVLITMPSEKRGSNLSRPHCKMLPEIDTNDPWKCPDVAFGIATLRCTLDDS